VNGSEQIGLFDVPEQRSLPSEYEPARPDHTDVSQIYLARGSLSTPERKRFVERICNLYPNVIINEYLDIPHNRIDLHETDALELHQTGKHTLVFGELKNAVRFSDEEGNTCPNYWHFSPYGFCPYGCKYCYLAGTQGVKFSPTIKIYVNLPEMLSQIDMTATRLGTPTAFYLGKLQDALALDPLTAYSTTMVPFFANHEFARLVLLTKSTNVERLLELPHAGHTILSWSINPPEVSAIFEENVPSVEKRLEAMGRAASAGYPVRAVMMPVIPVEGWQDIYTAFVRRVLSVVPMERLTIGGICIYRGARTLLEHKIGTSNSISSNLGGRKCSEDGRQRYPHNLRKEMYSCIINEVHSIRPDIDVALCLEDLSFRQDSNLSGQLGPCNCVL
jgi:spore photoproduct lyase